MEEKFFSLETVKWVDGKVLAIDQRLLPRKLAYIELSTCDDVARAIKDMAVRGAPAIGAVAAMGLALAARWSRAETGEELLEELREARRKIESTRPTAINLFWATRRVMEAAEAAGEAKERIVEAVVEEAKRIAREDVETNRKLGKIGAKLIEDGDSVLTHCKWPLGLGASRVRGPSRPSATEPPWA